MTNQAFALCASRLVKLTPDVRRKGPFPETQLKSNEGWQQKMLFNFIQSHYQHVIKLDHFSTKF
jgi:hypothetical protein